MCQFPLSVHDQYSALRRALDELRDVFRRADEAKAQEVSDPLLLVAGISTEHVTRETGIKLPELVGPEGKLNGGMTPYGCFLSVIGSVEIAPPDLADVLTACRDRGYQYVYLDRDALPVDWLPILWVEPEHPSDPDTLH